jgi:hypothetical protein
MFDRTSRIDGGIESNGGTFVICEDDAAPRALPSVRRYLTAAVCDRCGPRLEISLTSVFDSWEDEDRNRHYPVPCTSSDSSCCPVIVRDGCTGHIRGIAHQRF